MHIYIYSLRLISSKFSGLFSSFAASFTSWDQLKSKKLGVSKKSKKLIKLKKLEKNNQMKLNRLKF
jgi:hypothetical protein